MMNTKLAAPRQSSFLSHHDKPIPESLLLVPCRKSWNSDLQEPTWLY